MKVQLFLPATIVVSVVLVGVIKLREMEQEKEDKRQMFVDIKLRVTNDVLREYQSEMTEMRKDLDTATSQHKTLEEELKTAQMASEKAKFQAETCEGGQVGRPWNMPEKRVWIMSSCESKLNSVQLKEKLQPED